jgi:SAM-dependent methyltransferase
MRCLIVGNAKSGTSALLYAVAQAMGGQPALHFEVPIAELAQLPPHAAVKLIFEHERADRIAAFGAGFERRILLVRDPRDNLISRLLYLVASHRVLLDDPAYLRVYAMLLQRKQQAPASVSLRQLPPLGEPSCFLADTLAHGRALASFAAAAGDWFILRYEDLVAGRLQALSDYLGLPVRAGASVDPQYQRVARTKGAGDWRHWFTADDVAWLRPPLAPLMAALGYADDWTLAPEPRIAAEHSWEYFARLVHERRRHYGLAPLALPAPDQHDAGSRWRLSKGDIINRLIRCFGFTSYLEYNKFDGATYYADIVCDSKTLAYLPEHSYLDARNLPRLLRLAADVPPQDLLPLPQLLERHAGRRFDVIFFDPVHVRPDVDHALRALPALLNPGGVLVVHDCHPEREEQTSLARRHGAWVGETYKAFALLRHHNRGRAVTVSEDFGVGLVWNDGLVLDYPLDVDISYQQYRAQHQEYSGLMSYQQFLERSAGGDIARVFAQAPAAPARFMPRPAPAQHMTAQLFWRQRDNDFSEARAASLSIALDGSLQELLFTLPAAAGIEQLRFDIADGALAARIAGMELRNPSGALMWCWDAAGHAGQDWRNARFCRADGALYLIATGDDPQFHPALPASILRQLGAGWSFSVQLAPQAPLVGRLLAELARAQDARCG